MIACLCVIFSSLLVHGQKMEEKGNLGDETSFLFDVTGRKVEWQKVFLLDSRIQVSAIRDYFIKSKKSNIALKFAYID